MVVAPCATVELRNTCISKPSAECLIGRQFVGVPDNTHEHRHTLVDITGKVAVSVRAGKTCKSQIAVYLIQDTVKISLSGLLWVGVVRM